MTRKTLLKIISTFYALSFLGIALWVSTSWNSSQPVKNFQVKGASTQSMTNNTAEKSVASSIAPYPVLNPSLSLPRVYAKQYILFNPESGKIILQSQNLDSRAIASTTKLMTAYLASKLGNPEDYITISQEAASQIGSLMGLYPGEKISIENLLYGAMLVSGNDAVYAIAEHLGDQLLNKPAASSNEKVERFVDEMNNEAKRLKLSKTRYKDPAGLQDEGYSNALDLAKLASLVEANQYLKRIATTAQTTVYDQNMLYRHDLRNSNRLVADYFYEGVGVGKTGYTPIAGHCLVGSATRNGHTLIAVVLNTDEDSKEASARETQKLLDFGFSSLRWE